MNLEEICENVFGSRPRSISPVSGGCIAGASRIDLTDGTRLFAKQTDGPDPFAAEALCLQHLKVPGGVRVPDVLHVQPNLLILEWIDFAPPRAGSQARLGEQLAATHRKTDPAFGFPLDHVIGATPQKNLPRIPDAPGAWAEFWWTHRLKPMIRRLPESLYSDFLPLEDRISTLLDGTEEPPAILHGDLWSGNAAFDTCGQPVLFDPAAYYGHREADLSMTRMFGGFSPDFYHAYNEAYPLSEAWEERLDFYMLYHVLNHVILFGNSYLSQARHIAKRLMVK